MLKNSTKGTLCIGLLICWNPTIVWCFKKHKMRYKEDPNKIKLWTQPLRLFSKVLFSTSEQKLIVNICLVRIVTTDRRTDGPPGCLGLIVLASAWQLQVEIRSVKILTVAASLLTRSYHVTTIPQECNTNNSLATFGWSLIELVSICHGRKKISKIYRLTTNKNY